MDSEKLEVDDGFPKDLTPELNVLLGVHLLFWKFEELMDAINVSPALTKNERMVLLKLDRPYRMGALADTMQVLPSALTAIADGLESKGFIVRERDPEDRRALRLRLTNDGAMNRRTIIDKASEIFAEVSGLSSTDTQIISALMLKVAHNIKANGLPEGIKPCL